MLNRLKNLTVFHQGALGDFLLACPVFEALSHLVDSGKILFWTRYHHAKLIENERFFGGFFPHDDPSILPFFDDELWRDAPLPLPCRDADLVILFGKQSLRVVSERINKRSVKCLWCPSFPEQGIKQPVPVFIADSLKQKLCVNVSVKPFRLTIREELLEEAQKLMGDLSSPVFIHPGSGGIRKIWPLSRWMSLVKWIRSALPDVSVAIITGPADEVVEPFVQRALRYHGIKRFHNVSLPVLATMLSLGRLYIGNDSGISHLAAASGIPVIVIFGPTDPAVWAPWNDRVTIFRRVWKEEEILSMVDETSEYMDSEMQDVIFKTLRRDL